MRDYLVFAYWLHTHQDHRATAHRLGLTPQLVNRLATAWSWRHRASTDGRAMTSGNAPIESHLAEPAAHTPELNTFSRREWTATHRTDDGHWLIRWMSDLIQLQPGSRSGYLADVASYLDWCDADGVEPLWATRADIGRYRDGIIRGSAMPSCRPASPATTHRKIAIVRHLYDWLTLHGHVIANPARPLPLPTIDARASATRRGWLTSDERQRVIDTVDTLVVERDLSLRDRAIVYLLAYGAPRVSELSQMTLGSLHGDTLTWSGKRNRIRSIRLVGGVSDALGEYLSWRRRLGMSGQRLPQGAALFATDSGRPVGPRQVRGMVDRVCRFAGIPHRSPHAFRHGLITSAREAGLSRDEVQAYVGHARAETTARYEHVAPRVDAAARLWEMDRRAS